nr:CDP-glycerol glycerophosphotransferase family protein [Anaerofustis stercorihominis]
MLHFPVDDNKIVFISKIKKVEKTETLILKKLLKSHKGIKTVDIEIKDTDITELQMKDLATAKYIIMFSPMDLMAMLSIRKETKIIQLCDFAFAFTKFGLSRNFKIRYNHDLLKLKLRNEYDLVSVSANSLIPIFAEEWDIKSSMNIKALGSCQTDVFFDEEFKNNSFTKLYEVFPEARNKKIIFYMPLHRYRNKAAKYVEFLDISLLRKKLSDDYVIIINNNAKPNDNNYFIQKDDRIFAKDLTNILSMRESMIVSDIIIGDYRRTLFEAALLDKPIFLTAHDYAETTRRLQTRFKYLDIKLGPIINNAEELIEHISHLDKYDYSLINSFKDKYLTMCDGNSSQRILDYILNDMNQNKKDQ